MDDVALPDEFLRILRLSLKSSEGLVEALANTGGVPQSGHIRKIVEAILWHRRFILTYYIWIVAVVAISCGLEVHKRHQRRRRAGDDTAEVAKQWVVDASPSSSSSSTLNGRDTPPQKDDDADVNEETPLLSNNGIRERPSTWRRLRSFLLYQPRPRSGLTAPVNTLPDNGTVLVTVVFLCLNVFYLFYRAPLTLKWIFILVDRAGLLFVVNLPVLYVLAAKNNQPIKYLTGWSYEGLNIFHRRLGEWMTCFAVIHMSGMFVVWYTILQPLGFTLLRYLSAKVVLLGIFAVFSYYIIYITSVGWFRQLYYEAFLGLHIFFQVAALIFLFFHYPTAKPYVAVALAIWVIDRGIWRIGTSSRKFIATLEVAPDGQTVLLHADIPLRQQKFIMGIQPNLHHGWAPGQHVFLTMPSMGFKYRFQAHPFTIASPAPPSNRKSELGSWHLQLTIRAIEGFSLSLLNYAKFHQHCEIILDGPYGSSSAAEAANTADRVCFVAGGSGIAVTYPLAWDLRVEDGAKADAAVTTRTVYANGVRKWPSQTDECGPLIEKKKYSHFWVRQDDRHAKWITTIPKAHAVKQDTGLPPVKFPTRCAQAYWVEEVSTLITCAFDTRSSGPDGGRPDMKSEVWNWVTSVKSDGPSTSSSLTALENASQRSSDQPGNTFTPSRKDRICIIVSGPDGLVRDVRNIGAELFKEGWNIDIHVEKFGW